MNIKALAKSYFKTKEIRDKQNDNALFEPKQNKIKNNIIQYK